MWQNEHQIPSMVKRDLCQNAWFTACVVLAIVQLIALGYAAFGSRVLSGRSRVILAAAGSTRYAAQSNTTKTALYVSNTGKDECAVPWLAQLSS